MGVSRSSSPVRDAEKLAGSAADDKQISSSSSAVISEAAEKTDLENPPALPTFETPDTIPDGGYGWVVVATVFFINSSTWGVNSTYGVFLAHYLRTSTFPGATPMHYAFIGGLSLAVSMLISSTSTLLLRLTSTPLVLILGLIALVASMLTASFATHIWHLFLTQGVLFGIGIGLLFTGSVGTISQWFSTKRSLANGIASAGSGAGGLTYSLATRRMLSTIGLPWTFRVIALCVGVVGGICILLIRDRNASVRPRQKIVDPKLLGKLPMLGVLAWGFCSMLGYIVVLFSLPDYAASMGFSVTQGGILGAVLNAGMMIGRPLVGFASDRFGRLNIGAAMTLFTGILCFAIWLPANSFGVMILFAVLCGAVCGTFWGSISPIVVEVVGIRELPSALSLTWLGIVLPTMFAECIALEIRREGDRAYLWPQVFAGVMYVLAAGVLWGVRAWKVGDYDREKREKSAESMEGEGKVEKESEFMRRWRRANGLWRYTHV